MEPKFKVGDKVKVRVRCTGCIPDTIYTLEYRREPCSIYTLKATNPVTKEGGCSCSHNWILVDDKITNWKARLND